MRIVLLAGFATITLVFPLYAHSGRTDSSGGHFNRRTGSYHTHGGGSSISSTSSSPAPRVSYRTSARTSFNTTARGMSEEELKYRIATTQTQIRRSRSELPGQTLTSQIELTEDKSSSRTIYRIRLKPIGYSLPTDNELNEIVQNLSARRNDLAYFYLPTMDIKKPAWAVATKLSEDPATIRRFDNRVPVKFQY